MVKRRSPNSGHIWHRGSMIPYEMEDHRSEAVRPKILVVIPYYNAAPWIDECLARLSDNAEPHDILIVDDGSIQPLQSPAGMNVAICRFARNAGLITALNFAAAFAASEGYSYYVRQDADDFSFPDRLERQREAIEREQADLVVSGVRAVDEQGAIIWSGRIDVDQIAFRKLLAIRNPVVHSTWFIRTELFNNVGCYDEDFKGAEDFELLQRIARQAKITIVPDELVNYLVRDGSILSASRGPALQTMRIIWRYFDPMLPASYVGILRAAATVIASRRLKTAARRILNGLRR